MTVKLLNQKIFEGNTKVLDDIIHVCIGGNWYKVFAGHRIRDIEYTDEGMEFTSYYLNEYDLSRCYAQRFIFEGSRSEFVVSMYKPPFREGGILIKVEDVVTGSYIDTSLYKISETRATPEELERQIVWIEPNFEVVKENDENELTK